jgi:RsiW-degrading membrane proteinase PrsW (M82 family)
MARDGRLAPDDLVWQSGTPEWVPAAGVVPFGPPPLPSPAAPPSVPLPARLARDVAAFEPGELFPLARVADPEVLGVPSTWLLLAFGLAPLFVGAVVEDPALRIRLFRLGAGAAWAVFLVGAFRTPRASARLGVPLFGTGLLLAALLVSALPGVPPLSWILSLADPERAWPVRFLGWLLGAGLVDEGLKLLALLLLARTLGRLSTVSDGVFYGLLGGLGFGLWEAAATSEWASPRHGSWLAMVQHPSTGLEALFVSGLARTLALPVLEAVWGALAGYFAGLASVRRAPGVALVGLALAALLHGTYETFRAADQGVLALLVAGVSLLAFLACRRGAAVLDRA